MSLAVLAQDMASKGRNGDSMLVHMTPGEVAGLHALALKHGGSLTINPETGLPEANFLKKLLPAIAGLALNYFAPGFGSAISGALGIGGSSAAAIGAGIGVGGITTLATGSLSKGLMAGLGAYGGFGLGESLTGAGIGVAQEGAMNALTQEQIAQKMAEGELTKQGVLNQAAADATKTAIANNGATFSAGFDAVTANPSTIGTFAKSNLGNLSAAAAPIVADMMVPTATKVEPVDTGNIRKFSFDPYGQRYTPIGVFPAKDYKGMAEGGIVALAGGGGLTAQQFKEQMYAGGVDDSAATKRGLELAAAQGLNAQQTTNLWSEALGTKFTPDDYARVSRQYGIAGPQANVDFVKGLATNDITAPDFLQQTTARGLTSQDVNAALQGSGLSKGAQFALTNQNIGSDANASETYGGLKGLSNNINYWLKQHPGASLNDIKTEMAKWDLTDEDFQRATGKAVGDYATGDIKKVENLAVGAGGNNAAVVNPNGTVTQTALGNVAINPVTGERAPTTTMQNIKDLYTAGGGSLGYTPTAPKTMAEFNQRFNTMNPEGDSAAAYNYLMGKGAYPTKSKVGEIMKPYSEAVLGVPADMSTKKYIWDAATRKMVLNPDYVPMSFDTKGVQSYGLSTTDVKKYLTANNTATDAQVYAWALANNIGADQIAAALNADPALIRAKYDAAKKATGGTGVDANLTDPSKKPTTSPGYDKAWHWDGGSSKWVAMDLPTFADGGITGNGQLNLNIPLNLGGGNGGYSAMGSGSGFGSMPPEFAAKLGAGMSNNVAQSGLPDFRSQMQGLDAKIQQLPSVMAYNDYGKSITGRPPTADEMAQMDKLRSAITSDKGYTDLQSQMQSLDRKYQQQAMGNKSAGLQQRYMQQAPNVGRTFADGGAIGYALGGLGSLGGYSDGGRLLKGPGDGVSDSIPATIGRKQQPARLADGEFVIPARIVSELGNGSTDAGAKKLYAMMDRVQRARGKTTGKNKVAANSRAEKYLPA